MRLRIASDDDVTVDGSPVVGYRDGAKGWQMHFGLDANGDTTVRLFGSPASPITIAGNSTYNTFSLRFDPLTDRADFYVNDVEVLSNYAGFVSNETRVFWGTGNTQDLGEGYFNAVQLSTVPEPSTLALLSIGVCGLCFRQWRRRKTQSATAVS